MKTRPNDHGYVHYTHCPECNKTYARKIAWVALYAPGVKASEMRPPTMEEKRLAFGRYLVATLRATDL
jgi:hypothetical protein